MNTYKVILSSTTTFRYLVDSAARPGKLRKLGFPGFLGEAPLYFSGDLQKEVSVNLYALGVLLTLLDSEMSFAVAANGRWMDKTAPVVRWLAERSGAVLARADKADFALFCDGTSGGLLTDLNMGSLLEPEASATVLYCVESLVEANQPEALASSSAGLSLKLAGPGIVDSCQVQVAGLDKAELELIQATRQNYPLGLDVFLIDKAGQCMGLPRCTQLELLDLSLTALV